MVDLGADCTAKRWDKTVLFGDSSDGALQTADDIAQLTGTISYEITRSEEHTSELQSRI